MLMRGLLFRPRPPVRASGGRDNLDSVTRSSRPQFSVRDRSCLVAAFQAVCRKLIHTPRARPVDSIASSVVYHNEADGVPGTRCEQRRGANAAAPLRLASNLDGHGAAAPPAIRDAASGNAAGVGGAEVHYGDVVPAPAHRHEGMPAQHGHGRRTVRRRAASELAPEVVAPAIRGAVGGDAAGVLEARRAHSRESVPTRDGHWRRAAGESRAAGTALLRPGCRTVAKFAVVVIPPAVRGAAGGDAADVAAARAHRREGVPARHGYGRGAAGRRAVAELPVEISPPAVCGAAGGDAAGVVAARAHHYEGEPVRDGHGRW